jgi:hypothetical protein
VPTFPLTQEAYVSGNTLRPYETSAHGIYGNITGGQGGTGLILAKFNFPDLKENQNRIEGPANDFCMDGSPTIVGDDAEYYAPPSVSGPVNDDYVPRYFKWQYATSSGGPWVDIPNSDTKNLQVPPVQISGNYYYRRVVRQTSFEATCVPSDDTEYISNVVSINFISGITPTTNITDNPFGYCPTAANVNIPVTLIASTDGVFSGYSYKLSGFRIPV